MQSKIFYTSLLIMLALPGCKMASSQSVKNASAESLSENPAQIQATDGQNSDQTISFRVDDSDNPETSQLENPEQKAEELIVQAQNAMDTANYSQAFKHAVSAYLTVPDKASYDLAFYAASVMTPIEQTRMEKKATTDVERAILGQLMLSHCTALHDMTCVQTIQPQTVHALQAIGNIEDAKRIEKLALDTSKRQAPLVAVLLPLSGSDRKIGRGMLGSILQTAGIYHGESLPFNLRFFDTQSNVNAIPAVLEEVEKSGAKFILGPIDIQECNAVAKRLDHQAMIGFSPNSSFMNQQTQAFQFSYTLDKEIKTIATLVQSWQPQHIAIVGPEDTYVSAAASQFKQQFTSNTDISSFTYPATQTDLREIAQKTAKYHPDVIFLPTTADAAERMMSFMAQENIWCAKPGTPKPKSAADTRKFVTCVTTSAWAPIQTHRYKFIQNAIYLDYTDNSVAHGFAAQFETLYHRTPAVYEIMPYYLMKQLEKLPQTAYSSSENLQSELKRLFKGSSYAMEPSLRIVTSDKSDVFK